MVSENGIRDKVIGFIGAGMMAEALARGFINKGVTTPDKILCSCPGQKRKDVFATFGVGAASSNVEVGQSFVGPRPLDGHYR